MPLGRRHISVTLTLSNQLTIHIFIVIKYGIIFLGNSSNSGKIFTLQKKIIRIMAGAQPRTSCWSLFKKLEILPVSCQHILLLMKFIINNQEIFQTNSAIHNINSRNKHQLHRTNANLSCFQKVYLILA
jgi:IS1 family transposase